MQGDPVNGSFNLLGHLHLSLSFFLILRSGIVGVVEFGLLPRWGVYLFEHRSRLHQFLALRSRMPIFLAILARKDPRSSLTLSRERAVGSVVIRTPAVVTVSGWPNGVPLLYSKSLAGGGLGNSRSLWRSSDWCRGTTPAVRGLGFGKPPPCHLPLPLCQRKCRRLFPSAARIGPIFEGVCYIPAENLRPPRI